MDEQHTKNAMKTSRDMSKEYTSLHHGQHPLRAEEAQLHRLLAGGHLVQEPAGDGVLD